MLKNMPKIMTPELMNIMMNMGHSNELTIIDAHFPGYSNAKRYYNAAGIDIPQLLDAILYFMPLETSIFSEKAAFMMNVVPGDSMNEGLNEEIEAVFKKHNPDFRGIGKLDRLDFIDRAKKSFAIIATGETRKYSNVILIKGLAFPEF